MEDSNFTQAMQAFDRAGKHMPEDAMRFLLEWYPETFEGGFDRAAMFVEWSLFGDDAMEGDGILFDASFDGVIILRG